MSTERETAAGERCQAVSYSWSMRCKLTAGHEGQHIAGSGYGEYRWPDAAPQPRSTEGAEADRIYDTFMPVIRGNLASPAEASEPPTVNSPEVDRKVTAAEATERPAQGEDEPREPEGQWASDDPRRWFVAGAAWWEFEKEGATMWGTDRYKAECEAVRRWEYRDRRAERAEPDGALRERIKEAVSGALGARVVWQDVLDATDAVFGALSRGGAESVDLLASAAAEPAPVLENVGGAGVGQGEALREALAREIWTIEEEVYEESGRTAWEDAEEDERQESLTVADRLLRALATAPQRAGTEGDAGDETNETRRV
jgi:hypothetical protein